MAALDPKINSGSKKDTRHYADLTSPDFENRIPCYRCADSADTISNAGEDLFSIDNSLRGDGQDFDNASPIQDKTDGIPIYDLFVRNIWFELNKLEKGDDKLFAIAWMSCQFKTLKELGEYFGKKPPWVTQTIKRIVSQAPRLEKMMKKRR